MNINSTYFNRTLQNNMEKLTSLTQKLSTGKRINSASDDASGLQISTRMTAQNRGNTQAIRNIQDGISLLQTSEGELASIQDMLQRIRELSIQGQNGTYTTAQKQSIQNEMQSLIDGINEIAKSSSFNGIPLLSGKSVQLSGIASQNQHATIEDIATNLTPGSKTTVEFWMNWNGQNGVFPFSWQNNYHLFIANNAIGFNTSQSEVFGTDIMQHKNNWIHIAAVFEQNTTPNNSDFSLFINGEKQTLTYRLGSTSVPFQLDDDVTLGWGGPNYDYGGKIDELKIWDGERTGEQVKQDMYNTSVSNDSDLLGYWKLDENDNIIKDSSSYKNDGQLYNGASVVGDGVSQSVSVHTGTQSNNKDTISLFNVSDETLNLKNISLSDPNLIEKLDNAINGISLQRGEIGSKVNRYEFKINNLQDTINNTEAAQMRIEDLDMANAMSELTRADILTKSTQQMLKINNSMFEQKMQMLFN